MDRIRYTQQQRTPEASGSSTLISVCQGLAPGATAASTVFFGSDDQCPVCGLLLAVRCKGAVDFTQGQVRMAFVPHDMVTLANCVRGVTLNGQREPRTICHVNIERMITLSACPGPSINIGRSGAVVMSIWSGVVRVVGPGDVKRHGKPCRAFRVITNFITTFS